MTDTIIARIAAGELVLNELDIATGGVSISTASSSTVTINHNLGKVPKFVMVYGPSVSASNSSLTAGSYFLSAAAVDGRQIKSYVSKSSATSIGSAAVSTNTDLLTDSGTGFIQAATETTFRVYPGGKIASGTLYWIVMG